MGGDSSSRSANSGQQRSKKRSCNSSSNNSSNSRNKNSRQKTLGMAWGANSLSASRSSFRSSPFSDFGRFPLSLFLFLCVFSS
uniref:Uncharacterized protein n=1 Tax=Rhizophora mucronata TaxID=61149 RepID=A0A2P2KDF9_RHIMU